MKVIQSIADILVWIALGMNLHTMWRNQKLLQQLKRDTRIAAGYRSYYEERAKKEGINYPFPTPDELEGEEE